MNRVAELHRPETPDSTLADAAPRTIRRRWTVAEYHRMGEVGLLRADERVELIEGDVVAMAPIGPEHAGKVNYLNWVLHQRLNRFGTAMVSAQNPVVLDAHSEPEPDLAVLRWRDDFYQQRHPGPADVLLMIEVSDTTARADRRIKAPLYARHGIPEYWLVDLPGRRLEVYREPRAGRYRQIAEYRTGSVAPLALPEAVIDLAALFPAPPSAPEPPPAPASRT